jgi:hypothetical protein
MKRVEKNSVIYDKLLSCAKVKRVLLICGFTIIFVCKSGLSGVTIVVEIG